MYNIIKTTTTTALTILYTHHIYYIIQIMYKKTQIFDVRQQMDEYNEIGKYIFQSPLPSCILY